jgi:hypothetical protein
VAAAGCSVRRAPRAAADAGNRDGPTTCPGPWPGWAGIPLGPTPPSRAVIDHFWGPCLPAFGLHVRPPARCGTSRARGSDSDPARRSARPVRGRSIDPPGLINDRRARRPGPGHWHPHRAAACDPRARAVWTSRAGPATRTVSGLGGSPPSPTPRVRRARLGPASESGSRLRFRRTDGGRRDCWSRDSERLGATRHPLRSRCAAGPLPVTGRLARSRGHRS